MKKVSRTGLQIGALTTLFFFHTQNEDDTTIQPNGINCQTKLKTIESDCDSRSGQWLRQEVEAMLQ